MICGGFKTKGIQQKKIDEFGNPLITIITVVFNCVTEIEETILSVINQSYSNIEYIIIDGNSNDGTIDIIKKYENKIAYWQSEPDKGLYDAMNKGIDFANGEWLEFTNSGDSFIDTTIIEKIFGDRNANTYEGFDVIYGDCAVVRKNNEEYFVRANPDTTLLSRNIIYRHGASFIRTDIHQQIKFDLSRKKDLGFALDAHQIHSMYLAGKKFKKIDLCVMRYAEDGASNHYFRQFIYNYRITGFFSLKQLIKVFFAYILDLKFFRFLYNCVSNFINLFVTNHIVSHIPFFSFRKLWYKIIKVKLGKRSSIDSNCSFIMPKKIIIGKNTTIDSNCFFDGRGYIFIGDNVKISNGTKLITCSYSQRAYRNTFYPIKICDNVTIENNVIINQNIIIGEGAYIKNGAVVTEDIEPYSIMSGNPAIKIGSLTKH